MDSLLKHMVDMTGHRDHTMLDISVISAVQELAGATQTRVLSIATRARRSSSCARAPSIGAGTAGAHGRPCRTPAAPASRSAAYPELQATAWRSTTPSAERDRRRRPAHPVAADLDRRQGRHLPGNRPRDAVQQRHHAPDRRHRQRLPQLPEPARLQRTRFAHRPAQPQDLRRPARQDAAGRRRAGGAAAGRPGTAPARRRRKAMAGGGRRRPFQAGQRQVRPPVRRRSADPDRQPAAIVVPRARPGVPLRRRGIRRAAALDHPGERPQNHRALPQQRRQARFPAGGQGHRQRRLCQHQLAATRRSSSSGMPTRRCTTPSRTGATRPATTTSWSAAACWPTSPRTIPPSFSRA